MKTDDEKEIVEESATSECGDCELCDAYHFLTGRAPTHCLACAVVDGEEKTKEE